MFARIYKPSRTAMQSGKAKTEEWVLEFEEEYAKRADPLMGWTSGQDTRAGQVRLTFETKDQAIGYAKEHQIPHQVIEPSSGKRTLKAYSDNFATNRRAPWTH
ncbi:ETC complex I subunit [Parvularcula sp. ZS-1/3]|uniref:ETC complex I subunit n=1 Tax=Parvularcula mediterranea TaxID=2732508 RepID=A0A7Y3RKP7_9PROT|nr:NADH dehydrogenase ubiquinone Fe-S protein 4 [Parvularcula mediterranea]NNU15420.1 ETC complex I subunit [Parvularcula mediterranea]